MFRRFVCRETEVQQTEALVEHALGSIQNKYKVTEGEEEVNKRRQNCQGGRGSISSFLSIGHTWLQMPVLAVHTELISSPSCPIVSIMGKFVVDPDTVTLDHVIGNLPKEVCQDLAPPRLLSQEFWLCSAPPMLLFIAPPSKWV